MAPAVMAIFGFPVMRVVDIRVVEPGRQRIAFAEGPLEDHQQLAMRRPVGDLRDPVAAGQLRPQDIPQRRGERRRLGGNGRAQ